jgi:AbrB family looped-hinge helix DNA binding protein
VKITTKGQVTIPQPIRERFGMRPGAEVEFETRGNAVSIRLSKRSKNRGRKLVEHLKGRGDVKMTTDEIMALTRQY